MMIHIYSRVVLHKLVTQDGTCNVKRNEKDNARETMGSNFATAMVKKPPALRLRRRPTAKTTGLLDKFKVSKLPVGVGVPSATVTSGEGRSEQLEHTRGEKVERNKNHA